jgi:hypothetical protein
VALIDALGKDQAGVIYGGANILIGAKTSNGAAGTLFNVGYLATPPTLNNSIERTKIYAEQEFSPVADFMTAVENGIDAELLQNNLQNMRMAMSQTSTALTGAANGALLVFNNPVEEAFQVQLVVPGPGTGTTHAGTKIDTYTYWNCRISQNGPIKFDKKGAQIIPVHISILPDSTIAGSPEFVKGLYGNRGLA